MTIPVKKNQDGNCYPDWKNMMNLNLNLQSKQAGGSRTE